MAKNLQSKSAWVVTWDWAGDHAKVDDWLVAILSSRLSAETVKDFVERFYVSCTGSPAEKLAYAKDRRRFPYRPEFDRINGVPYEGRIWCGDNPFLHARFVDNLKVDFEEDGEERLTWDERDRPDPLPI